METVTKAVARLAVTGYLATLSAAALAGGVTVVASDAESGPGTLRDALEHQGVTDIRIPGDVGDIVINSTLVYAGEAPLTITGSGQTPAAARRFGPPRTRRCWPSSKAPTSRSGTCASRARAASALIIGATSTLYARLADRAARQRNDKDPANVAGSLLSEARHGGAVDR